MTSAAEASPSAILRLSSARASLTALARSRARSRCGPGLKVAVSLIWSFASSQSVRLGGSCFTGGQGSSRAPSRGSFLVHCCSRAHRRAGHVTPIPAFPTLATACAARPLGRGRSYDIRAGNSNVTSGAHALRACFFSPRKSCASVDKAGRGNTSDPGRATPRAGLSGLRPVSEVGGPCSGCAPPFGWRPRRSVRVVRPARVRRAWAAGRARLRMRPWPGRRCRAPRRGCRGREWPSRCSATARRPAGRRGEAPR